MVVQVREGHLLRVDAIDSESLGHCVVATCAGRGFSLGASRGCLEAFKDACLLLCVNLARELRDEFAQWPEPLVLVAHKFDELLPVSD